MIELIEKQGTLFRLRINGSEHEWCGTMLWRDSIIPLPIKVKGSTLGWNTCGIFVSYWQLKKVISASK